MLYWTFLGVVGATTLWGTWHVARTAKWRWIDAALIVALLPVALWSVRSYVGTNLVGAGDAHHYALQVADFITQARAGTMPVMVGNSDYAFNGNVHTLRTAPYFTHFAGLLDLLTLHRLTPVVLQNLTVTVTAMLTAVIAYLAALHASGRRRLAAWLLACLCVLSPGIVGPLALNDMFATYMAAPALVLMWFGLAGMLSSSRTSAYPLIAAGALGVLWFAHSPLGAWGTLLVVLVVFVDLLRRPGHALARWRILVGCGLLLLGLAAYAWFSVATLGNSVAPPASPPFGTYSFANVAQIVAGALRPYDNVGAAFDLQLGAPLWLLLGASVVLSVWPRRQSILFLLVPILFVIALLFPWPGISEPLWRLVPDRLVALTVWPPQRFYPLLASGAVVWFAFALRTAFRSRAAYAALVVVLTTSVAWSAHQISLVHERPGVAHLPPKIYEPMIAPESVYLSRYSYALFENVPPYFTHGWTDPEFETRLLDPLGEIAQENSGAIIAATGAGEFAPLVGEKVLMLEGAAEYLLVFAFADPAAAGEIVLHAPGIRRAFALPSSGESRAFGAGPEAAKTVPLRLKNVGAQAVSVAATAPGVSFRVVPIDRRILPIQVTGQTPFRAKANAKSAGFLETPHMFIEGYSARVNGRTTAVKRSPHGLVMVPVPVGESTIVLHYPGPLGLRIAWFVSLACFAAWPWVVLVTRDPASAPRLAAISTRMRRPLALVVLVAFVVMAGLWTVDRFGTMRDAYGSLRLRVKLPANPVNLKEPLLTLGRPGAADCVFVLYEGDDRIRCGVDHWGFGGPLSDLIAVDFTQPHTLEITLGGLYPPSGIFGRTPLVRNSSTLRVKLDDHVVIEREQPFHPASAEQVYLGRNPLGASGVSPQFSGLILSNERFVPSKP